MASISAATQVQIQLARDTTFRLARELQALVDGTHPIGANMTAANVAAVDAVILANKTALAPIQI
jgi:hypothetical protein